jgi:hypothetical protein
VLFLLLLVVLSGIARATSAEAQARSREGSRALAEQRYLDARAALREAVRLDPDFAGAWLDLALASYALGEYAQAEELLDTIEARFAVPPPLIEVIAALREQIAAAAAPPAAAASDSWRWRRQVSAAAGHDSNANAGLAHGELTLTLPGGAWVLPVARESRARADTFSQAGAAVVGSRRLGKGILAVDAGLQLRRNADVKDFDTEQLRAGLTWTADGPLPAGGLWGLLPGPWQVRSEFERWRLDADTLTDASMLGFSHLWLHARCQGRLDLDVEQRTYPVARSLDATYLWLGGGLDCPGGWGPSAQAFFVSLRAGKAFARHGQDSTRARPGGDSRHLKLTAGQAWRRSGPTGVQTLRLEAQWEHVRDTRGYSPLLDDGARRRVDRRSLALSYTVPLALHSPWRAVLTAQQFRQTANLAPFELDGRIVQLGLERAW